MSDVPELRVYSTRCGELYKMVHENTPECFVLYEQGLELIALIKELQEQLKEQSK